jgi:hypothetical protein
LASSRRGRGKPLPFVRHYFTANKLGAVAKVTNTVDIALHRNKLLFGPKRDKVTKEWRKLHNESFIICTHPQISLGRSSQEM